MADPASSAMAREIYESADVVSRIVRSRHAIADVAKCLDIAAAPLGVLCGRGSSGHAAVFLRYLIETRLHLPVSISAPSVITAFRKPLTLRNVLFIVISQYLGAAPIWSLQRSLRERPVLAPSQSSMWCRRRLPMPPNSSFRSKPGPNILSPRPRRWSAR
jgi:glutamine---fructose-6-phosphate transaminase (isomerizing)